MWEWHLQFIEGFRYFISQNKPQEDKLLKHWKYSETIGIMYYIVKDLPTNKINSDGYFIIIIKFQYYKPNRFNIVDMCIAEDTLQLFGVGSGHSELVRGGVAAGHPVEQLPLDVQEETWIEFWLLEVFNC